MSAVIAVFFCTYLAGAFATFGAMSARSTGETTTRTMIMVAGFSWLAFGYLVCGGKLDSDAEAAPPDPIKLPGNRAGFSASPWDA